MIFHQIRLRVPWAAGYGGRGYRDGEQNLPQQRVENSHSRTPRDMPQPAGRGYQRDQRPTQRTFSGATSLDSHPDSEDQDRYGSDARHDFVQLDEFGAAAAGEH